MAEISPPHSATIKRHLEESQADGVPLQQIHRELLEIFRRKGRYSLQQITAKTSWLLSQALQKTRVTPIDTDEYDGRSNEDVDFNNPEKNESRAWHFGNIVKHTSAAQRAEMRFLLMPGQNTYDLDAAIAAGLQGSNLLTFMQGKHPKSAAQYIRNARKYGVVDRRLGDMELLLPQETSRVHGGYFDFWGQFCNGYAMMLASLPVPADYENLCVGINIMKGREHEETTDAMTAIIQEEQQERQAMLRQLFPALPEGRANLEEDTPMDLEAMRDLIAPRTLLMHVGTHRTENWAFYDEVRSFMKHCDTEYDFDELTPQEKAMRVQAIMRELEGPMRVLEPQLHQFGIRTSILLLLASATTSILNVPTLKTMEEPDKYKSAHKNRPFVSYFGVVETRRRQHLQRGDAVKFFLDVAKEMHTNLRRGQVASNGRLQLGLFSIEGSGRNKDVVFSDLDQNVVARINDEYLHESTMELGATGPSWKKEEGAAFEQQVMEGLQLMPPMKTPIFNSGQRIGRNDPCSCGSGRKYKKCCLRC